MRLHRREVEDMVPEECMPVGEIDDDQPAGDQRPAEDHGSYGADQFAEDALLQGEFLHRRRGENLPDGAAGEGQLGNAGSADAEVIGDIDEGVGRECEEQHQAEEQHQLPGEEEQGASGAGQKGPHRPQQREKEQNVGGQPEEIEEPVGEEGAEIPDPVFRGGVDSAGDGGSVSRAVGEHGQEDQQKSGKVEDVADPEIGFLQFRFAASGRSVSHNSDPVLPGANSIGCNIPRHLRIATKRSRFAEINLDVRSDGVEEGAGISCRSSLLPSGGRSASGRKRGMFFSKKTFYLLTFYFICCIIITERIHLKNDFFQL